MSGRVLQRRQAYRLLLITLWLTLLLLGVEAIAGWACQSLLLLAEALHTLVDGFAAGLGVVAIASPQRPLGRETLGHGRGEVMATLALVAIVGFTGVSLMGMALGQGFLALSQGPGVLPVTMTPTVVGLVGGLIVLSWAWAGYGYFQSRPLPGSALALNARHLLQDAWLSGLALGGAIAIAQGYPWVDPLLALGLVPLAACSLWQVLNNQLPMLLRPMAIAPEAIAHVVTQVEGVTRCIRIRSRGLVGRQVWIELQLAVHPDYLATAQGVGERVEAALRRVYGPVRTEIWMEESSSVHPYQEIQSPWTPPPPGEPEEL